MPSSRNSFSFQLPSGRNMADCAISVFSARACTGDIVHVYHDKDGNGQILPAYGGMSIKVDCNWAVGPLWTWTKGQRERMKQLYPQWDGQQ